MEDFSPESLGQNHGRAAHRAKCGYQGPSGQPLPHTAFFSTPAGPRAPLEPDSAFSPLLQQGVTHSPGRWKRGRCVGVPTNAVSLWPGQGSFLIPGRDSWGGGRALSGYSHSLQPPLDPLAGESNPSFSLPRRQPARSELGEHCPVTSL